MTLTKQIDSNKCDLCGKCIDICPTNAISIEKNPICNKCPKYCLKYELDCNFFRISINYNKCTACNKCIDVCKRDAISNSNYEHIG